MRLHILSEKSKLFDGPIDQIQVPSSVGPFQIKPKHAPILAHLVNGVVTYTPKGTSLQRLPIQKGILHASKDHIALLVTPA